MSNVNKIEEAVVNYDYDGVSLHIEVNKGRVRKEINWSAKGSVSFAKAEEYAHTLLKMKELGEHIFQLLEKNKLKATIEEHVWVSKDGKYKFVPMKCDSMHYFNQGYLGIDLLSKSVKYFKYGRLLAEFDKQPIGTLKEDNKELFERLRAEQLA